MLQKVQAYIEEQNMIVPGDRILAGVSGGADSVALLMCLYTTCKQIGAQLEVLHVEHGIRGAESLRDADFVKALCQEMEIPCHRISADVPAYAKETGMGYEEAARKLRYDAFASVAREKAAKVALAHHMEDNAETILFQMARGSALAGVCGMQPIRTDENGVTYIRPFLTVHRSEIEQFLKERGEDYRTDSTNLELDYSRNYIRQKILPELTRLNAKAVDHMNETALALSQVKDFLEQEVEKNKPTCIRKTERGICLEMKLIQALHPALQKELLYRGITEAAGNKKDISSVHVKYLQELYTSQSGKEIHLPYNLRAKKEYDRIWLLTEEAGKEENEVPVWEVTKEMLAVCRRQNTTLCLPLSDEGTCLQIRIRERTEKNLQIPQNSCTKWLDYDKINQGFCIRTRKSGDYFISDATGRHKALNRYMIDEKIPSGVRDSLYLLAQENLILWLIGGRISEHVKITDDTKAIIELKYQGGNGYER